MAQDKGRASSVESREEPGVAEVSQQHHTSAGVRRRSHFMELHHQEVLERACLIHGQGPFLLFPLLLLLPSACSSCLTWRREWRNEKWRRVRWSTRRRPSSRKWPKTKDGPPQWRAGRTRVWSRCANNITPWLELDGAAILWNSTIKKF